MSEKLGVVTSINPANGEIKGRYPKNDLSKMKTMFSQARSAQKVWAKTSFTTRARAVYKIQEYVFKNRDRIARIISESSGKTYFGALATEIFSGIAACSWYAQNTSKYIGKESIPSGSLLFVNKKSYRIHQPVGVVGIISPWNYPFAIPFSEVIMALMSGNAIFLKVATVSVRVGVLIEEVVSKANLPNGLFNHIIGNGPDVLDSFLDNNVNKIFFTGSVPAGKNIMEKASKKLIPVCLELGGNDPMIVLNDADLERAVNCAVWAGASNCGQSCAGVERIYVQSGVHDEFVKLLSRKVRKMKHGVPNDRHKIDFGSMTTKKQVQVVKTHLDDAVEKGAKVSAKSKYFGKPEFKKKGFFHPVVVLIAVNHSMTLMKEETFGPLLPVMKFDTIDEVVKLANDSQYALTASVFTNSNCYGKKLAASIDGGVVTINGLF